MSKRLSQVTRAYLDYRAASGFAVNTVKNDRQCLRRLTEAVGDVPIESITPMHLDRMLGQMLTSRRYTVGTINTTQSALSAFFRWCRSRGVTSLTHDPIAGRRYMPQQENTRARIPLHDFPRVLDAAVRPRNRALIALGLYTLCRQSELVPLRVKHLDLDAGWLDIVVVKSYKTDVIPLSSELDTEMRRWVKAYQKAVGGPLDPEWYLLPALYPTGFQQFGLAPEQEITRSATIVRRVLEDAGYTDDRLGVHTLRRSAARALFDELVVDGYDGALRLVSSMLHHSSVTTTEKYLGLDLDKKRRDTQIAGQPMYPSLSAPNVVTLTRKEA